MEHGPDVENPLLQESSLPYQLPPFAAIRPEHLEPAFTAGAAEQLAEIEAIASQPEPPTFANTIEPLERSGELLRRTLAVLNTFVASDATPEIEAIDEVLAPRLAAHDDAIHLHAGLAARIIAVEAGADAAGLTPEQRHLVRRTELEFRVRGAGLDDTAKAELAAINSRLAELSSTFERRLLADANAFAFETDDAAELDGLDADELATAAADAAAAGNPGRYRLPLTLFTNHPKLAVLQNRETRRRLFEASIARGSAGTDGDNSAVVLEIVRLRARRAALLGFPNHAAVVAAESTAGSPEAILQRLALLAAPAARNARAEAAALQALADEREREAGRTPFALEPWDWSYYAELLRARDFDVDTAALRPYFEAHRVLVDGVFWAATQLYGLRFEARDDLVGLHPDVSVFEVSDDDGPIGLFLLDLYARPTKRGGAWMNDLIQQNRLLDQPTIVTNTLNVPKPAAGSPTLLTLDEVETLFHEFGHALHGLLSRVDYPSNGGTNVPQDFVEFPSQVNEHWMLDPAVLANMARHVETGATLPAETIERLVAAEAFNEGFATVEYLAAAVIDMAWHTASEAELTAIDDIDAFERGALEAFGLDLALVPPRYRSRYFMHTFSGGYSAGYYGYIWSEVLDADAVEWFEEHGGLTRENGQRFRDLVLGIGGSRDAMQATREFLGREPRLEPLLERRGLTA